MQQFIILICTAFQKPFLEEALRKSMITFTTTESADKNFKITVDLTEKTRPVIQAFIEMYRRLQPEKS